MFPLERYGIITNVVNRQGFVSFQELLELTKSSLTTLRRDISYLIREGKIKKAIGGVSSIIESQAVGTSLLYENRKQMNYQEKLRIAEATQQFIENTDVVLIFNGTTISLVVEAIDRDKHLTIITNGIDTVEVLRSKPNIQSIILGGIINYKYNYTSGPTIAKVISSFNPNKIITGAGGITREKGITNYDIIGNEYYKGVFDHVEKLIVVADSTKFGRNVLSDAIPFEKVTDIVTDKKISQTYIDFLKMNSINYILV